MWQGLTSQKCAAGDEDFTFFLTKRLHAVPVVQLEKIRNDNEKLGLKKEMPYRYAARLIDSND